MNTTYTIIAVVLILVIVGAYYGIDLFPPQPNRATAWRIRY